MGFNVRWPWATPVIATRFDPILAVRDDWNAAGLLDLVAQSVRIMPLVSYDWRARRNLHRHILQRRDQQLLLTDVSGSDRQPQRQAAGVHDNLQLHTLAGLGFSHIGAPFFVRMNVASANNSSKSISPNSSSSSSKR